jgi:AsmA protein
MQYLKVTGQGTVDLPRNALDYKLVTTVLKIPREGADTTQMQDMVDAQIPVKVSGSLADPKVRPDVENYLKGEVKKKVEEKLKDKLGDKLKDIFKKKQ